MATAVKISAGGPAICADAGLPVFHELAAQQERHTQHLTGDLQTAIDYVATLDADARAELRTLAVGDAIDFTEPRGDHRNSRNRKVGEKIAAMLSSDYPAALDPRRGFFSQTRQIRSHQCASRNGPEHEWSW